MTTPEATSDREAVAATMYDLGAWEMDLSGHRVPWASASKGRRDLCYDRADAVLAVLRARGWQPFGAAEEYVDFLVRTYAMSDEPMTKAAEEVRDKLRHLMRGRLVEDDDYIARNRARLIANGAEFGSDADMRPDEPEAMKAGGQAMQFGRPPIVVTYPTVVVETRLAGDVVLLQAHTTDCTPPKEATMGEDAGMRRLIADRNSELSNARNETMAEQAAKSAHRSAHGQLAAERDSAIVRAEKAEKERDAYREAMRERSLVLCETHRIGYSAKHGCAECKIAAVEQERDHQCRERAKEAGKLIAAEGALVAAQAERDRMRAALRDMRSLFKPSEKRAGVVYWTANNATTLRAMEAADAAISPHDGGGGSGNWHWRVTKLNLGKFTGSDGAGGGGSGEAT